MPISRDGKRPHKLAGSKNHPGCSKCTCPILIVENQKTIAYLLDAAIKDRYGYVTVIAANMKEAELAIQAQPIHLAISDLNLPDAPNGEIIDLLTRHNISTIALTSAFGLEMRKSILNRGAIDYIPKQSVHAIEYAVEVANRIYENHHTSILVVDDSLSSREVLKNMLETLQFNITTANDGKEALTALTEHPDIKLILVDYEMPGMNGCELIQEIRNHSSKEDLAIIGVSASNTGELSARFLKSGANDFVRKPFSYEEIFCRVSQNLEVLELIRINREAAYTDYLTGLHNRRYFFQEGSKLHGRTKKDGTIITAMMDIDHFKIINDTYGHDSGDLVLKKFSQLCTRHFDKHFIARIGGEEFAAIICNSSLVEAKNLFDTFRIEVENSPVQCGTICIPYTVSIGLTDQVGETIDELIKAADQLLYVAKTSGRNRVVSS
jgi:diguanylate cyclase (GGDEF)-like protein